MTAQGAHPIEIEGAQHDWLPLELGSRTSPAAGNGQTGSHVRHCTASLINPFPSGLENDRAAPLIYLHRPSPSSPHLSKCLLHKLSTAKTVLPTPPQMAPLSQSHTQLSALAPSAPSFSRVCADPRSRYLIHLIAICADFHHIDLLAHFDRERIPERVVRSLHR